MNKTPRRMMITFGLVMAFAVLERSTGPLHNYRTAALVEPAVFLTAAAVVCRSTRSTSAYTGLALLTVAAAWNLVLLATKADHVAVLFAGPGSADPVRWGPYGDIQALIAFVGAFMVILAPTRPRPVPPAPQVPEYDDQPRYYTGPPRELEPRPYYARTEIVESRRDIPMHDIRISPPNRQAITSPPRHRKKRR